MQKSSGQRLRTGRQRQQAGFIPMIIMLIVMLATVIFFAYKRVLEVQH